MLTLTAPSTAARFGYRFTVAGGAAGGIASSLFLRVEQTKVASEKTVSSYALLLDCGGLAVPAAAVDEGGTLDVLVSHVHADHCSGVPALAAARHLLGGRTRFLVGAEEAALDKLRQMIRLSEELNEPTGALRYLASVHALGTGSSVVGVGGPAGRSIVPFPTVHRITSTGFCVVQQRKKLRQELLQDVDGAPLSKAAVGKRVREMRELRAPTEAMFDTEEDVEIAYTGDTTIAWLSAPGAEQALRARLLVTEATFLCDRVSPEQAAERGHTHLSQIIAQADRFEHVGQIVLTHFSRRYNAKQVQAILAERLPTQLLEKTHALLLDEYHREGCS